MRVCVNGCSRYMQARSPHGPLDQSADSPGFHPGGYGFEPRTGYVVSVNWMRVQPSVLGAGSWKRRTRIVGPPWRLVDEVAFAVQRWLSRRGCKPLPWGFESLVRYGHRGLSGCPWWLRYGVGVWLRPRYAPLAQFGRGVRFRSGRLRVRISQGVLSSPRGAILDGETL